MEWSLGSYICVGIAIFYVILFIAFLIWSKWIDLNDPYRYKKKKKK